jgi:predicted aspartyl protease
MWTQLLLMAVVFATLTAHAAESLDGQLAVALSRTRSGLLTVPVEIGGRAFTFLLDTGSARTVLSTGAARAIDLKTFPGAQLIGATGATDVEHGWVDELRVGPVRIERHLVVVLDLTPLARRDVFIDGILGADVLLRGRMQLDFAEGRLWLGR